MMTKVDDSKKLEAGVRELIIMLLIAFVLGVLLTTVIGYDSTKHSQVQTVILALHIIVALGLLVRGLMHIFAARKAQVLGYKPLAGFVCVVGAFGSGSAVVQKDSDFAVLIMALLFAAALVIYGLSFLELRSVSSKK